MPNSKFVLSLWIGCPIPDDHIGPSRTAFFGNIGISRHSGGRATLIYLHSRATTTPKVRAAIQTSAEPALVLAERYGTTEQTVWKWRERDGVNDHGRKTHRLHKRR